MNHDIKAAWLKALRGGNYNQGQNALFKKENEKELYCCLGVLVDLYLKEKGKTWESTIKALSFREHVVLPTEVVNWSGLPDENPFVNTKTTAGSTSLAELNDFGVTNEDGSVEDFTFEKIALLIEEQL